MRPDLKGITITSPLSGKQERERETKNKGKWVRVRAAVLIIASEEEWLWDSSCYREECAELKPKWSCCSDYAYLD